MKQSTNSSLFRKKQSNSPRNRILTRHMTAVEWGNDRETFPLRFFFATPWITAGIRNGGQEGRSMHAYRVRNKGYDDRAAVKEEEGIALEAGNTFSNCYGPPPVLHVHTYM